MRKLDEDEIKEYVLNILLEFDSLCKKNGLQCYLAAGTLLGAIRHHGFIPWDDDIDVYLSRPDYDRLLQMATDSAVIPTNLEVLSYSNSDFKYPYIKVIDNRTFARESYTKKNIASSLWIDVFPIDGLPSISNERKKIFKKAEVIERILSLNLAEVGKGENLFKMMVKPLLIPFARCIGADRCNKMLDTLARRYSYESAGKVGDVVGIISETMDKKEFEKSVSVIFEGHYFKTMSCWDSYLKNLYGNYMNIPPESERVNHSVEAWIK